MAGDGEGIETVDAFVDGFGGAGHYDVFARAPLDNQVPERPPERRALKAYKR